MKYLDGYRDPAAAAGLSARLAAVFASLRDDVRLPLVVMEVCGTHTMAIARYGIRDVIPEGIDLVSGPGCPVCVTPPGYIDAAIALAARGARLITFGDMLQVPGSASTLADARAGGACVEVCYSPSDALRLAASDPARENVFLGIGFETTVAPVLVMLDRAVRADVKNLSVLTAFKCVPPALKALLEDPDLRIDAFLCPAHVSAIIGADAYGPVTETYGVPCVIAGFEPLDILLGLLGITEQVAQQTARVDNQYSRVVRPAGNPRALSLMRQYLEPVDAPWRGIGTIPASGLALRPAFAHLDAASRFELEIPEGTIPAGCGCGDVIKGKLKPASCPLFGHACRPDSPVGPCMVSAEGACAAAYKYARHACNAAEQGRP
jgi:hydrogenase expression/formation protein HypD